MEDNAASASPLSPWVPENLVMGPFRIERAIGHGATGSVFVAHRVEDEEAGSAIRSGKVALKVPLASGGGRPLARWFREEVHALTSVPEHPCLAQLVAFDLGAQPKPFLVMEHIPGPTLDHIVAARDLRAARAVELLSTSPRASRRCTTRTSRTWS